jgi:hypothetical protein
MAEESWEQREQLKEVAEKEKQGESKQAEGSPLPRKLDAVGWALFLIWIGIVLLAKTSSSVALVGIGIIILGVQVARVFLKLSLEGFWFVVGLLFLVGGIWQMVGARFPLVPILLIVAGVALLVTRFMPKR